jgi:quinol monooxygenase YgiN
MHVITVLFKVKPGCMEQFRRDMVANADASVRLEPGCRQFDVCTDPLAPDTVFLYEVYDSKDAFDAHLASAHFRSFNDATTAWVESKTVSALERIYPD